MTVQYFELDDGSQAVPDNLLAAMLRRRYDCNPDFEHVYATVTRWWAEVDVARGLVLREVGFDACGQAVVLAPFGRNSGLWTGVSAEFGFNPSPTIEKSTFEATWKMLDMKYREAIPVEQNSPRFSVSRDDQILGRWSAPSGDQALSFLPECQGSFEEYNYVLMYYDEFVWEINSCGRISIRGTSTFSPSEKSHIEKTPSNFQYVNISVQTQVPAQPHGRSVEVLHLPLSNKDRGWVSDVYLRCDVPISELRRPEFDY